MPLTSAPNLFPSAAADLCVKCGLCLPACPTYAESGSEADSPRGRIALMQRLVGGLIPLSESATRHLDGCLSCRSCEAVCPAKVPYGQLIDAGRAWQREQQPTRSPLSRGVGALVAHRGLLDVVGFGLWLVEASGLRHLAAPLLRSWPGLRRLDGLLPRLTRPRRLPWTDAVDPSRPMVNLFVGCLGPLLERPAIDAAIDLLEAAGYALRLPRRQGCCGALQQHDGSVANARRLLRDTVAAFDGDAPIVALASGCALGLRDGAAADPHLSAFAARLNDIFALLLRGRRLTLRPLHGRVAVQLPCTQRFMKTQSPMLEALSQLPGIDLQMLEPARGCCGAAGVHFLTHAEAADSLLDSTLNAIVASRADLIVSANIGCRLHIRAGLARRGLAIEVLHPLELLRRQLE